MDIGMLWYDDSKNDLETKVGRAAAYYFNKYGVKPSVCYVHPEMLEPDTPAHHAGVLVRTSGTVIKHHFWLGVDDDEAPDPERHA